MTPATTVDHPDDQRGVSSAPGSTKARIERAALNLFVERGVEAATTREIAARAGLSEGALYRYFAGKEEIAETLFTAIHKRLADLVRGAGARTGGVHAQIEAVVEAYCSTADDDWALFSYHLLTLSRFLPTPPDLDDPVSATEDIIAAARARGELDARHRDTDVKILAAMALGVVQQTALHRVYGRITTPMSDLIPIFKTAVASMLLSGDNPKGQ